MQTPSADAAKAIIKRYFAIFGPNKRREVSRLVYEISRREGLRPEKVVKKALLAYNASYPLEFATIKAHLIKRRFPEASAQEEEIKPYLPELDIENLCYACRYQ